MKRWKRSISLLLVCGILLTFAPMSAMADVTTPVIAEADTRFPDVPTGHAARVFILEAAERGIVRGFPNGNFNPNGTLTRAEAAMILWNMAERPAARNPATFTDIAGHWAAPAITWVAEMGIAAGRPGHLFAPNDMIQRQELFTLLWNFARAYLEMNQFTLTPAESRPFQDQHLIRAGAENAIMWLHAAGLVRGDGAGNVNPQGAANRAEIVVFVMRFIEEFMD